MSNIKTSLRASSKATALPSSENTQSYMTWGNPTDYKNCPSISTNVKSSPLDIIIILENGLIKILFIYL